MKIKAYKHNQDHQHKLHLIATIKQGMIQLLAAAAEKVLSYKITAMRKRNKEQG